MRDVLRALFLSMILCAPLYAEDRAPSSEPARPTEVVNGTFWIPRATLSDLDLRRAALGVLRLLSDDDDSAEGVTDGITGMPAAKEQHRLQAGHPAPRKRHAAPLQRGNVISFIRPRIQVHIAPPLPPVFAPSPAPVDSGRRPGAVSR